MVELSGQKYYPVIEFEDGSDLSRRIEVDGGRDPRG